LIVIYMALSVLHITNQNVVYGIDSRSRLNELYIGRYFSGPQLAQ